MASALAHALLGDGDGPAPMAPCTPHAVLKVLCRCLGAAPTAAMRELALTLVRQSRQSRVFWRRHTVPTLAALLQHLPAFQTLARQRPPYALRWFVQTATMRQGPVNLPLTLPDWPTPADLATGLGLSAQELHWLTHPALGWRAPSPSRERPRRTVAPHYRCILRRKASGGLRLIEAPLPLLKAVQRQLLDKLLAFVPPHEAAHGFVPGRDVASHTALHAGQAFVAAFDLRDFFHSVSAARVQALWRTLGFPEGTARALTALCTTRTPQAVRERLQESGSLTGLQARRLASAHLPQGAPTSPALANLCAFGLDLRLSGLAERFGARYSRYADDLVFSGPAALGARFRVLQAWVDAIARAEGFALHPAKTRRMPAHRRQRVTGLVVNEKPNLPRDEYDLLRARLHRLALQSAHTPVAADVREALLGQLAWARRFVCVSRAQKLERLFEGIVWGA